MQKYFLAVVPPEPFLRKVEQLKLELKDQFGIKYALKSPAHITVKMPFSYDEHREKLLIEQLSSVVHPVRPFDLSVSRPKHFGNRVIFLSVGESPDLRALQAELRSFCKKQLHLVEELSDRNYTPHMTVAFKDLKPGIFDSVYTFVRERPLGFTWEVAQLCLLKKIEGKWIPTHFLPFLVKE